MKPQLKKIIVKAVKRVSLVNRGANLTPGLYKSQGEGIYLSPLFADQATEDGLLYGLVYTPMTLDSSGHYMDAEGVLKSCHSFAENGMALDIQHNGKNLPKEAAVIVESSVLTKQDDRYPEIDHLGRSLNHEGAWAVTLKLGSEDLRKAAREGTLAELSLECAKGDYELVDAPSEDVALLKSVASAPPSTEGETASENQTSQTDPQTDADEDMKPEELQAALDKALSPLTERLDRIENSEKKDKETSDTPPLMKSIDLSDPVQLKKMQYEAALRELQEEFGMDSSDVESLNKSVQGLGREELAEYAELVSKLQEEYGYGKTSRRSSARTSLRKRDQSNDVEEDDSLNGSMFEDAFKAAKERHATLNAKRAGKTLTTSKDS